MDDFKKKILNEVWKHFRKDYSRSNDFLDALYQEGLVNNNTYQDLPNKPRDELLDIVYKVLINSKDGYQVFAKELEKDYKWIFEKLQKLEADGEYKSKVYSDALIAGAVPRPPQNYIERTQLLEKLRSKLKEMQPVSNNKILLYGMNGIGKSSLAAAAIKDPDLLLTTFNNKVFWINVGKIDEQQIFDIMYRLYRKIVLFNPELKATLPKEKPETIDEMKDNLTMLFRTEAFNNSLIVLDNVCKSSIVKYFDAGCNLLITSQERLTINHEKISYLSVQDGFSEEESLRLFANCLETSYDSLKVLNGPSFIHNWCKGDPMLISLCAGLIEDRKNKLLNNHKEWFYLIDSLNKKTTDLNNKRYETISLCYERLDADLKLKYQDFAVFVFDINITPEVLMILWDLERFDVEEVMNKLKSKCLVVSEYNDFLETDVYGIHHVFLNFIKDKIKESEIIRLHRKLIEAYKKTCNYNLANLPNDNYIFQYIGYHLYEAKMFNDFSLYFDLDFIGAKIKATGIADLLRDFTTYKECITKNEVTLNEKLDEYINFVKMYGQSLHKYPETDIIQSALLLEKDSLVYKAAWDVLKLRSNTRLYFESHAPHESNYYTHVLTVNIKFKAACFTEGTKEILIGTQSGTIEMWEPQYMQRLQTFTGHTKPITYLKLNEDMDKFLSVSEDGCVKVWNLSETKHYKRTSNGIIYDENGYNNLMPSPRVKQLEHQIFFGSEMKVDRSNKTYRFEDDELISAAFANTNDDILTGSKNGKIILWRQNDQDLIINPSPKKPLPINCVTFSYDDSLIIVGVDSDIIFFNSLNGELVSRFFSKNKNHIRALHPIPYDDICGLIAVRDANIVKYVWNQEETLNKELMIKDYKKAEISCKNNGADLKFLCSTITDNYLVVGSTDMRIKMWDIENHTVVEEFYDQNGQVICLDAMINEEDKSIHILLTGFEDKTVKMWHVQPNQTEVKALKNLPVFDAFWCDSLAINKTAPRLPLVAIPNSENSLQILKGHKLTMETENLGYKVTNIKFSRNGKRVYYSLENGDVYELCLFGNETRNKKIMTLYNPVSYLDVLQSSDLSEIIVASTDYGKLSIYKNKKCIMLMDYPKSTKLPIVPVLKSFYLPSADKLLTVSKSRNIIKVWNLEGEISEEVLYSDVSNHYNPVVSTCISQDNQLLCVTTNNNLHIFSINYKLDVSVSRQQAITMDNVLTCSCFSEGNAFLALGCENGSIVIWDVAKKRIYGNFELHDTAIQNLYFSPSDYILISVAEQIAWWNIKKLPENSIRKSFRSRSNSTKLPTLPPNLDLNQSFSLMNISDAWCRKIGKEHKPELLSTIKLHGSFAKKVSFTEDFESFLTVDNQGEMYIMEIIKD